MNSISNLYPQYKYTMDRRQNNVPVEVERRSGQDRRQNPRIVMDSQLTRDIYDIKERISKIENFTPKLHIHPVTTQNPTFAEKNNFTQDQFIKTVKPDITEAVREEAKLEENSGNKMKLGLLAAALASAAVVSFLGTAGFVIATGAILYVGSKVVKTAFEQGIHEDRNNIKNT